MSFLSRLFIRNDSIALLPEKFLKTPFAKLLNFNNLEQVKIQFTENLHITQKFVPIYIQRESKIYLNRYSSPSSCAHNSEFCRKLLYTSKQTPQGKY